MNDQKLKDAETRVSELEKQLKDAKDEQEHKVSTLESDNAALRTEKQSAEQNASELEEKCDELQALNAKFESESAAAKRELGNSWISRFASEHPWIANAVLGATSLASLHWVFGLFRSSPKATVEVPTETKSSWMLPAAALLTGAAVTKGVSALCAKKEASTSEDGSSVEIIPGTGFKVDTRKIVPKNKTEMKKYYILMALVLILSLIANLFCACKKEKKELIPRYIDREVEKIVEVPIERIVEVPVDRIVEVEKIVERIVEVEAEPEIIIATEMSEPRTGALEFAKRYHHFKERSSQRPGRSRVGSGEYRY